MSVKSHLKNSIISETTTSTSNSESEFQNELPLKHKQYSTQSDKEYRKSNAFLFLIIFIGFVLIGVGGFYLGTMKNSPSQNIKTTNPPITTKTLPSKESQNSTQSNKNNNGIEIDWPQSTENTGNPNFTGILTPEIKETLKKIIESESHVFTDRKFFTFVVYENWKDGWIEAAIAAPSSKDFVTAQGEPYSRILMNKTPDGWVGHLECSPGYLQMEFFYTYQSKYRNSMPELDELMKLALEKNPNSPSLHCQK